MVDARDNLEDALIRTEADAEAALKSAAALASQLKRAKKAAGTGSLRELERALEAADDLAGALRDTVRGARGGWRFDDREYLESGSFAAELLSVADAAGVRIIEQEGRLLSYPSLVRVLPSDGAIEIDRRRQRSIRPSFVVETLKRAQTQQQRFRPEQYIETLLRAYRLVLAESGREIGSVARAVDLYRVLTLLPLVVYSQQEFARDLYLLDESGETRTKEGLTLSFAAATGTKGSSSLTAITRDGQVKPYYGVAFRQ